jgi:nucleoside-diphosphate-sugar epimerase
VERAHVARVLITGASGLIGRVLRRRLSARYDVVGLDHRAVRGQDVHGVNLQRLRSSNKLFAGIDVVIDLAASAATDTPWQQVWKNNLRITMNVLEAARANGVRRYIFASSNHVTGMYECDEPYASITAGSYDGLVPGDFELIDATTPHRPDSAYAIGKVFGEAAARHYSDAFGLSSLCLRFGTVRHDDTPALPRHFATLLTQRDLAALVESAVEASPDLRFGVYYGVSENRWRFWNTRDAKADLGYAPADDAETFRRP